MPSDNYNLDEDNNESQYSFLSIWGKFFRILLSPVEGWKQFKRLKLSPEKCNSVLLFPALALCAVVTFISAFVWQNADLQKALPMALEQFCSYFFAYFCVLILAKPLLPKDVRELFDKPFGKNFIAVAMTSLILFEVLLSILPMLQPVLVFLPLWTIFIICRGTRILGVPAELQTQTDTILSILVIGLPLAINWLFSFVIPG